MCQTTTDAEKECDHLCEVTAPFATSVARIAARDGIAPATAARRLNAQTPAEVLLARADLVVRNDADLASLEAAAAALCEQLQAEGARKGGADCFCAARISSSVTLTAMPLDSRMAMRALSACLLYTSHEAHPRKRRYGRVNAKQTAAAA